MSIFLNTKQTVDIALKDDNVVTVKAKLTMADQAKIQRDLIIARKADNGGVDLHTSGVLGQKLSLLRHSIKSWRGGMFVDDYGRPVPYSPEMLDALDPEQCEWWVDIVAAKIDELNKPAGGDDPKPEPSISTA